MSKIIRKVFISSTVYDLEKERSDLYSLFTNLSNEYVEFRPIMSDYPTTFLFNEDDLVNKHSYDVCIDKVKYCNYMVLLINKRYNLRIERGDEISITHSEYKKA